MSTEKKKLFSSVDLELSVGNGNVTWRNPTHYKAKCQEDAEG